MLIVSVLVGAGSLTIRYLSVYYHATITAQTVMFGVDGIEIEEEEEYYRFSPAGRKNVPGIIFYPGAKIEETAYAPMLAKLAESGYEVYLMRMPFRLAILKPNAADKVMDQKKQRWILMGHSLGGSIAADYTARHQDQVAGLVLLSSYSTAELSDTQLKVLCIYGDQDQVMSQERYGKNRKHLPDDAIEHVIDGGNHSGFGYYGVQEGDGEARITQEEQQEEVVDLVTTVFAEEGGLLTDE